MTTTPSTDSPSSAVAPDSTSPTAATASAAHGGQPTRGIGNVPRSSTETGKFGRLFRTLSPLSLAQEQIDALVATMIEQPVGGGAGGWSGTPAPTDGNLDAGWTYFAQFVDHDITFDPTSMLDTANDPDALENFRTPRFDLDSVYGLGPSANPWLYDKDDPDKLLLGSNPPEFSALDLSRNQQGRALIGDPRNDVHVIVAQLHLAFVSFHNHVVDQVRTNPALVTGVPPTPLGGWGGAAPATDRPTFGQIVTLVRWHYQWLVLTGFLPAIAGAETVESVLQRDPRTERLEAHLKLYSVRRKPWMPVEFSAGAYRFGHSLVRDAYVLNAGLPPLPVFSAEGDSNPLADLRGFRRIPSGWNIEWHRFFTGLPSSGSETQKARKFDTQLSAPMHHLPASIDAMGRSIATLNIKRGVALQLPSGEDFAIAAIGKLGGDAATATPFATGLSHPAPLWFWFLKEAEMLTGGLTLGPLGGRVVTEVLVGLAKNDRSSFLRAQPDWRPNLGTTPGEFTIADLLSTAELST